MGRGNHPDDVSLRREARKGDEAEKLITNKILKNALDSMKSQALLLFESSQASDKEGRENIYHFIRAINEFEKQLGIFVKKGNNAKLKLEIEDGTRTGNA